MTTSKKTEGLKAIAIVLGVLALNTVISCKVAPILYARAFKEAKRISRLPVQHLDRRYIAKNAVFLHDAPGSGYDDSDAEIGYDRFMKLAKTSDVIIYPPPSGDNPFWYANCKHSGFKYAYKWKFVPPSSGDYVTGYTDVNNVSYDPVTGYITAVWKKKQPQFPSYTWKFIDCEVAAFTAWCVLGMFIIFHIDGRRMDRERMERIELAERSKAETPESLIEQIDRPT